MIPNFRILIVDDHSLFSSGAAELIQNNLNIRVDKETNPKNVLAQNYTRYDLLVTDIDMPEMNGLELIEEIKKVNPNQKILVITMHNKLSIINKCREFNVGGYILKFDENETLLSAITAILEGKTYYSKQVQQVIDQGSKKKIILTPREEEVIKMIAVGHSLSEIAEKLFISTETAKSHTKNIRIKLNVKSKSEIIQYARDNLLL